MNRSEFMSLVDDYGVACYWMGRAHGTDGSNEQSEKCVELFERIRTAGTSEEFPIEKEAQ